jgi:hypothetical protein
MRKVKLCLPDERPPKYAAGSFSTGRFLFET